MLANKPGVTITVPGEKVPMCGSLLFESEDTTVTYSRAYSRPLIRALLRIERAVRSRTALHGPDTIARHEVKFKIPHVGSCGIAMTTAVSGSFHRHMEAISFATRAPSDLTLGACGPFFSSAPRPVLPKGLVAVREEDLHVTMNASGEGSPCGCKN